MSFTTSDQNFEKDLHSLNNLATPVQVTTEEDYHTFHQRKVDEHQEPEPQEQIHSLDPNKIFEFVKILVVDDKVWPDVRLKVVAILKFKI